MWFFWAIAHWILTILIFYAVTQTGRSTWCGGLTWFGRWTWSRCWTWSMRSTRSGCRRFPSYPGLCMINTVGWCGRIEGATSGLVVQPLLSSPAKPPSATFVRYHEAAGTELTPSNSRVKSILSSIHLQAARPSLVSVFMEIVEVVLYISCPCIL